MGEDDCNYTYQTAASRKLCCGTWWNQVSTQQLVEAKEVRMNLPFLLTPAFFNGDLDVNSVVLWVTWLKDNGLIYRNLPSFEHPSYILPCFNNNDTSDKFVSIDLELFAKFDPTTFLIHSSSMTSCDTRTQVGWIQILLNQINGWKAVIGYSKTNHQRFGEPFWGGCHFSDSFHQPFQLLKKKWAPIFFFQEKNHAATTQPRFLITKTNFQNDPKPAFRFGMTGSIGVGPNLKPVVIWRTTDQPVGYPNGKILRLFRRYPCRN